MFYVLIAVNTNISLAKTASAEKAKEYFSRARQQLRTAKPSNPKESLEVIEAKILLAKTATELKMVNTALILNEEVEQELKDLDSSISQEQEQEQKQKLAAAFVPKGP